MPNAPGQPVLGGIAYGFPRPASSGGSSAVTPDFIASTTTVYTPTVAALQVFPDFIGSVTTVYTPTPSAPVFFDPISEDFLGNPLEYEQGLGQGYDDFTLEDIPPTDVRPSFIASATVVYTPRTSPEELRPPFIGSTTSVFTPAAGLSGSISISTPGTYTWICPSGVTTIDVVCYGGGGGGGSASVVQGAGAGGGAFAERVAVPVTPGTSYTFVVGAPGAGQTHGGGSVHNGASSTFTGDSGVQVIAVGGSGGNTVTAGAGGLASASTGDTGLKFDGGTGGAGGGFSGAAGGGGASGNSLAAGANGTASGLGGGGGGIGTNGGGSGGDGSGGGHAGGIPGGGGSGGPATDGDGKSGGNGEVTITVITATDVVVPFIPSVTVVDTPTLSSLEVLVPFIGSHTVVYQPTLRVAFTGGGVSQVALEVLTSDSTADAYVSQVTLEIIVPWYDGLHIWEKTGQTGG